MFIILCNFSTVYAWKLSRTKQLTTAAVASIDNAMTNVNVLSNDYFETVDQTDNACFYFPDLALGEAVILPGLCDLNVPVVRDFNAERVRNVDVFVF